MKFRTLVSLSILILFAFAVVSVLVVRAIEVDNTTESVKFGG